MGWYPYLRFGIQDIHTIPIQALLSEEKKVEQMSRECAVTVSASDARAAAAAAAA